MLELTGCKLKLETTVKLSDLQAATGINLEHIHFDVSDASTSDYSLYTGKRSGNIRIIILEAKTNETMHDDSVAQVMGYYLASKTNYLHCPPMGLIITQNKARIVFFPFQRRDSIYANAVVTNEFNRFDKCENLNSHILGIFIVFVSQYILTKNFEVASEEAKARLEAEMMIAKLKGQLSVLTPRRSVR